MSELKSFDIVVAEEGYGEGFVKYRRAVYDKSEADKVIAELKQKTNEVQTELELWRDGSIISEEHQKELDGKRHSDYKRCLKNREICVMRCDIEFARQYPTRASFWMKWERKWLELAEKFKEDV